MHLSLEMIGRKGEGVSGGLSKIEIFDECRRKRKSWLSPKLERKRDKN